MMLHALESVYGRENYGQHSLEGFKTRIILPSGAGSMLKEHIQGQSVGGS